MARAVPAFVALLLALSCASGTPHAKYSGQEIDPTADAEGSAAEGTEPPVPPPSPKWCPKGEAGCAMPDPPADEPAVSDKPLDPTQRYEVEVSADDPRKGPPTAPVTLIVFSDFQCPFCKRLTVVLAELSIRYPQQIQIVWKDLPLAGHEFALPAALLAREAYARGGSRRFWELHDVLFIRQHELNSETLAEIADRFDLSWPPRDEHQAHIDQTFDQVLQLNIRSTPTTFVNGRPIIGAQELGNYERVIDEELSGLPLR